jgi:putative OmpL-like beta-barrel porin-2
VLIVLASLLAQVSETSVHIHGFVDTFYAFDGNRPAGHTAFEPGFGTTAQRMNEFALNLAAIEFFVAPEPIGLHVALAHGAGIDVLHAAEPSLGPVYQAYASARIPVGRGLVVDAGIFSSHVGVESFFSKDNLNYTRSWMGELSPYYQAGLRASYAFDERWSAQVHLLNGWQRAADDNRAKTVGTQIAWATERTSFSFNTLVGPELPGDDSHFRFFGDLVAQIQLLGWLTLAATCDGALQQRTTGSAHWVAAAAYARAAISKLLSVALRLEEFRDPDGAISGAAQVLREGTATLEIRPVELLILKLEARHDSSSAPAFHGLSGETLLIGSAVAAF